MTTTGVLILNSSNTYGKTDNNKRLLYKCIPYKGDPILIPYEIKLGFSKHIKNKFISFHLIESRLPQTKGSKGGCLRQGIIDNVFGDVDDLTAYYEYEFVSRGLFYSSINKNIISREYIPNQIIENRFFENVFTIDNENTIDYDDAFSIKKIGSQWKLSIYITNVAIYIKHFNLWNKLREGLVSNIYLPHRKIKLLPSSLVNQYLSLKEGKERYTICLDVFIDINGEIVETNIVEALVCVKKNYIYESAELLRDPDYQQLLNLSMNLSKTGLTDSHEVVAHWMEFYNSTVKNINHIYVHHYTNLVQADRFLSSLSQSYPKGYYFYNDCNPLVKNDYVHCTSPIRRIVDIYNQSILLSLNFTFPDIDFINEKTKQIRKLQMESSLMNICFNNPNIMKETFDGIIFDCEKKENGWKYLIYLTSLKMISQIKSDIEYPMNRSTRYKFQLFLFQDEHQIKKKIKIKLVE